MDEEFAVTITSMMVMDNPHAELAMARTLWSSKALTVYSFTYNESGPNGLSLPSFPWQVEIMGGQISRILDANNQFALGGISIEDLFAIIEFDLNHMVGSVEVTYDKVYGFPSKIVLDSLTSTEIKDFVVGYH